jgi:chromosome segregation ATPase
MREGESVVLLYEDFETGCDTAATPYVTSANTNHEWRVFVNPQTGLDELIDTVEALKREMSKEFKEIYETISGVTEKIEILSGFVSDMYDEMQSGFTSAFTAINDLQEELDRAEEGVGLAEDGSYVAPASGLTSASTSIVNAIEILSDVILEDEEVAAAAFNDLNSRIINLSGVVQDMKDEQSGLKDEVDAIEQAVGLDENGNYIPKEGTNYLDGAGDVEEEIGILDEVLKDVADEVGELKEKTIEPLDGSIVIPPVTGNTTYIGVNIDSEDKHIVLGDNGLYFDGEFKDSDEDDEDFYD